MLTSEELKALGQHIENAGGNARNGEHIRAAIAIMQAAKDRPQPEPVAWMNHRHELCGLQTKRMNPGFRELATPLYTHPPQPAEPCQTFHPKCLTQVDKLIEAGDGMAARLMARDAGWEAVDAWEAAKSAAPTKVDVDAVMEVIGWDVIDAARWDSIRERLTKLFNPTT
jgi:hypothetical protein